MANSTVSANPAATLNPPRKRKRAATSNSRSKEPRPKPIECPVCLTARSPNLIHTISACNCMYCVYCIREVFSVAQQNGHGVYWIPAMCCDQKLDFDLFQPYLSPQLRRSYRSKEEEEKVDHPLYCGNQKCKEYILKESIKDGFGSCGKCKMKTCVKPECKKPRSDHLGIHVICPDDLETKELKALADEKGWKRCPKCYALTERIRGCNDIRCICRTEWCYTCGKAVKGTKDACQCHPPPARPTPQPAPYEIQLQREVIIVRDDGNIGAFGSRDVDMADVKPSIEDLEAQYGQTSTSFTDGELLAELIRHTDVPGPSNHQAERDFVAELDSLTAPNGRGTGDFVERSAEPNSANTSSVSSNQTSEPTVETAHDSLESLLEAFNSYKAPPPDTVRDNPIFDLGNEVILSDKSTSAHLGRTSPEDAPDTTSESNTATAKRNKVPDDDQARPTENSHVAEVGDPLITNSSSIPIDPCVLADESTTTRPIINPSSDLENVVDNSTSEEDSGEPRTSLPRSGSDQDTVMQDDNPDWLMNSIEEYLGAYGGDIKLERRQNDSSA